MRSDRDHSQHYGERKIQKLRHAPEELTQSIPHYIQSDMPQQHAEFYDGLSYLPLCTMDELGRPWVSILVTRSDHDSSIGINLVESAQLKIESQMSVHDPFFGALKQSQASSAGKPLLFAGVGVDFSNRRRNKIAGEISSVNLNQDGRVALRLKSNEHLGNCPKYITLRELARTLRTPELAFDHIHSPDKPFSGEAKRVIDNASTVFFATKHVPHLAGDKGDRADMGLNHRGGAKGFVRTYQENATTYLVVPDFSGNRFYQSLGNVESSQLVGLAFPDFITGDMLYITGVAENLYDADAEKLMPRVSLLTRIQVTGSVLIRNVLNLTLLSDEKFSPYNPPVRYLSREFDVLGHANNDVSLEGDAHRVALTSVKKINTNVSTFRFKVPKSIEAPVPGGFAVFDFSALLDTGYRHMDDVSPQAVNEDYIRTWTISSAPEFDIQNGKFKSIDHLDITVKHKNDGLISSFLHSKASELLANGETEIMLKGTGGQFSCFNFSGKESSPSIPKKMLWFAGGVGITPFMSMWDGLLNVSRASYLSKKPTPTDVFLVFAGREDDLALLRHFLSRIESLPNYISLKVVAFQSDSNEQQNSERINKRLNHEFPNADFTVHIKRVDASDLEGIDDLLDRETYMCGPDTLATSIGGWLESRSGWYQKIHKESYFF